MRLDNLPKDSSERIKSGDRNLFLKVLSEELEAIKNDIIYLPEGRISELRGRAVAIATIIKLLQ